MTTWNAKLSLRFTRQGTGRSVLSEQAHEGPILVQRALYPEGPEVCHVAVLHPPSGIAGGDAIDIDLEVARGAHATLTTPGATRWYKANGRQSRQTIRLAVQEDARLDWLPMENLYFENTDAVGHIEVQLEPRARAIGWEISQLGSILQPGYWQDGRIHASTVLSVGGRMLWVEQGIFSAQDPVRTSMAGLAGLPAYATLWCFGPPMAAAQDETLAALMPWRDDLRGGITVIHYDEHRALYLVRSVGLHTEEIRDLLIAAWMQLRREVLGVPATPLRLWNT